MRKPHIRWAVLTGAAAVSLAAFGFPALATATEDAAPSVQSAHQESTYLIGGYRVTYLPPGLEQYSSDATASTEGDSRTARLTWLENGTVRGRVDVRDHAEHRTLAEVRDAHYSHLSAPRMTTVNGHPAYLSDVDGEVFWVDEHGTALGVFLDPARWSSAELMAMAEGISRDENAGSTFSVTRRTGRTALEFLRGQDGGSGDAETAQDAEEEQPRLLPAPADAPTYPSSGQLPSDRREAVVRCLAEETGTSSDREIPTEGSVSGPWGNASWNSGLWALVPQPERSSAIGECARRTGLDRTQVQEVADGSADSSGQDGSGPAREEG
ncbi:hypothetical protein [Thermobifida cellulosilytica]|uniref:Uncharacterized protein n=1 Tax=Thermobifida cellulosilytica TB100 TaxID=665004 RepID=A0A147KDB9_THECS|nr:hypothetical protein [Thermobifida cellulosilytica]KUP95295.1 hypothetical protein AC529_18345 [Thermobifida cellulosilytica TB100]